MDLGIDRPPRLIQFYTQVVFRAIGPINQVLAAAALVLCWGDTPCRANQSSRKWCRQRIKQWRKSNTLTDQYCHQVPVITVWTSQRRVTTICLDVGSMLVYRWSCVYWPAVNQHWFNVLCLMGAPFDRVCIISHDHILFGQNYCFYTAPRTKKHLLTYKVCRYCRKNSGMAQLFLFYFILCASTR